MIDEEEVRCPTCDGTGEVHSHNPRCWTCRGTGTCTRLKAEESREAEERIRRAWSPRTGDYV